MRWCLLQPWRWLCQDDNSKLVNSLGGGAKKQKYDRNPLHQTCMECRHPGFEQRAVGKVCGHNQFDATRNLLCWRHKQISWNPDFFDLVSLVDLRLAADTTSTEFCCYACWMLIQCAYVAWASTPDLNGRTGTGALLLQRMCPSTPQISLQARRHPQSIDLLLFSWTKFRAHLQIRKWT